MDTNEAKKLGAMFRRMAKEAGGGDGSIHRVARPHWEGLPLPKPSFDEWFDDMWSSYLASSSKGDTHSKKPPTRNGFQYKLLQEVIHNDYLPPDEVLALKYDVSPARVQRVRNTLNQHGFKIVSIAGGGYLVAGRPEVMPDLYEIQKRVNGKKKSVEPPIQPTLTNDPEPTPPMPEQADQTAEVPQQTRIEELLERILEESIRQSTTLERIASGQGTLILFNRASYMQLKGLAAAWGVDTDDAIKFVMAEE